MMTIEALQEAREAISALMLNPHGCSLCDSGVPRNNFKGHQPDCPYTQASATLAKIDALDKEPAGELERVADVLTAYASILDRDGRFKPGPLHEAAALLRAAPNQAGARKWSDSQAVDLAHRSGFAGTSWVMGPEELAHTLNLAAAAQAQEKDAAR
jgi:hypothetical protein